MPSGLLIKYKGAILCLFFLLMFLCHLTLKALFNALHFSYSVPSWLKVPLEVVLDVVMTAVIFFSLYLPISFVGDGVSVCYWLILASVIIQSFQNLGGSKNV